MKLVRVIFANAFYDFYSAKKWLECIAIDYVQLGATTKLSSKLVKSRLEIRLAKDDARQVQIVEFATESFRFDEWRAENFEWPGGPATFGNVRAFQQTHSGINRGGVERRHVGRRHDPGQARAVEPHRAFPISHWQDG